LNVKIEALPFCTVDWSQVEAITHPGVSGDARWRTRQFGDVRVRMLEYSAGYVADHWCSKGHFLLCLEGELDTELADGRHIRLTAGMGYQVADGAEPHRSASRGGARLYVID
jgi:hypothetical protein